MKQKNFGQEIESIHRYCSGEWRNDQPCLNYSYFVERWYAATIDIALFLPMYFLSKNPFERQLERLNLDPESLKAYFFPFLVAFIPWVLYFYLPTLIFGQTLGKRALGIEVICDGQTKRSPIFILLRESLGKIISAVMLGAGFLACILHPKRKAFHDMVAKTSVVTHKLERRQEARSIP